MRSNWLTPRRSGYLGALAFTLMMLALLLGAKIGAWDSVLRQACGETLMVLTYPLNRVWEALLPALGFEGESVMIMAIPMAVSWLLYAAAAGFLFGWSAVRIGTKKEPIQPPQPTPLILPDSVMSSPLNMAPSSEEKRLPRPPGVG